MSPALALALVAIAAFEPATELPDATRTVALLPVEGAPAAAADVDALLRAELKALPGVLAQPREDTEALLGDVGCELDALGCRVIVGRRLGVKALLRARLDGQGRLSLIATDVQSQLPAGELSLKLPSLKPPNVSGDARLRARDALAQLLVPERSFGSLRIRSAPDGALLVVDGIVRGTHPLAAPIDRLAPGKHVVEAKLAEGERISRFVEVHVGEETEVDLAPAPAPAPDPQAQAPATAVATDLLWYGAGGTIAALGVGSLIAAGGVWLAASATIGGPLPPGAGRKDVQARLDAWSQTQLAVIGLSAAGAVALVAGGALAAMPLLLGHE